MGAVPVQCGSHPPAPSPAVSGEAAAQAQSGAWRFAAAQQKPLSSGAQGACPTCHTLGTPQLQCNCSQVKP